jgi:hypothetical protein
VTLTMRRLLLLLPLMASPALANPRPLPFTYPYETLPAQALEVEQVVDLTPVRALDTGGTEHWVPRSTLITELEYGITSRLELGFYFQLVDEPALGTEAPLRFDGLKQRLRYRLGEPGAWPVDVALYGEVAELRNEIELEGKIILQRRLGPVRVMTNLWLERELYHSGRREWVLHPTLGAAYEFAPWINAGLEGWLVREIADGAAGGDPIDQYNAGPLAFAGPTLFLQGNRGWLALGAYARLTDAGRAARIGDRYGRFWVRALVGIDL